MHILPKSQRRSALDLPHIVRSPIRSERFRILLAKPRIETFSVGFTNCLPPLDVLTTAAAVEDHEVRIVDMRLEDDADFERIVTEFAPHVLGVTCYSAEAESAKRLCARARAVRPELAIVQGGYHAAMAPEDALDEEALDFVVTGEAETILPPLLAALAVGRGFEAVRGIAYRSGGEIAFTSPAPRVEDLDTLPYPDWSLLARYQKHYYLNFMGACASLETTRGCPFDCNFCSVWVFNDRSYRRKSPERVLEELDRLPANIRIVMFVDDEFWVDDRRSLDLADLLLAQPDDWRGKKWYYWAQVRTNDITRKPELVERWARAGMRVLLLGIESVKDAELKVLHRKRNKVANSVVALRTMHRYGLEAWGSFIINPDWEVSDFKELQTFVRDHEVAFPQFTVLTPLPGTPLMDQMIDEGRLDPRRMRLQLLDFLHTTVPTKLPLDQFYEQVASLYRHTGAHSILKINKRVLRSGLVSKQWLRSGAASAVSEFYRNLGDPHFYLEAHIRLGDDLGRRYLAA